MVAEAQTHSENSEVQIAAPADTASGEVLQLADGRAAVALGLKTTLSGDPLALAVKGQFRVAKASGVVFADGDDIFWDKSANTAILASDAIGEDFYFGKSIGGAATAALYALADLNVVVGGDDALVGATIAAGTALTASSTETVMATFTIPANTLRDRNFLEIFAQAIATATNSTDTFRFRLRIGGVAGAVIADSGAVDLANNDVCTLLGRLQIRTDGASGTMVGAGQGVIQATAFNTALGSTAIDTTADTTIVLTGTVSTTSGSNSCRADIFQVAKR